MKHPHIATGRHMEGVDPRFRINTTPGVMEPKHGANEAHGSFLQRHPVIELRDELDAWLKAHPTTAELVLEIVGDALDEEKRDRIVALIEGKS